MARVNITEERVELTAVDKTLSKGLRGASDQTRMFGSALDTLRNTLIATVGIAGVARFVKGTLDAQDALAKASQKIGIAVADLAGLQHAAQLAGVSNEGLEKGLKTLSTTMFDAASGLAEAKRYFAALGLEIKNTDGTLKSANDVMVEVADKFAGMKDGAAKSALAVKLFGRAGLDMIPMLNEGSAAIAGMIAEGKKLNPVTEESAKQSEIFNDNMERLTKSVSAVGISIVNDLLPSLSSASKLFAEAALSADGFWKSAAGWALTSGVESDAPWKAIDATTDALEKQRKLLSELEGSWLSWFNADDILLLRGAIAANEAKLTYLKNLRRNTDMVGDTGMPPSKPRLSDPRITGATTGTRTKGGMSDERIAQLQLEAEEELAKATAEAWDFYTKQQLDDQKRAADAQTEMWRQVFESDDQKQERAIEEGRLLLEGLNEEAKRGEAFARDLGLTFTSAFEDAIVEGKGLREVLKGMEQDILRIVTRRLVTEPLGDAISSAVKGSDIFKTVASAIGGWFGGGKASGGQVYGGVPYLVGERGPELIVPRAAGTVVPNEDLRGRGRAITIVNQFAPGTDRRTVDQASVMMGAQVRRALARNT